MTLDETREIARRLREEVTRAFIAARSAIDAINRGVRVNPVAGEHLVDAGFYLREVEEVADELRKEAAAAKKTIGQVLCMEIAEQVAQGGASTIRGTVARARGDMKTRPKFPKPGTVEYAKLCQFFGVPERAGKFFHPSFREMSAYMDHCAATATPYPEGLVGTFEEFDCVFTRHSLKEGLTDQRANEVEHEYEEDREA